MRSLSPKVKHVIWVGPFPVSRNGISEYYEKIAVPLRQRIAVSTLRLYFSNWQRSYPIQLLMAVLMLAIGGIRRPRRLVHLQHCPFSTGPGSLLIALEARLLGLRVVTTVHEERRIIAEAKSRFYYWRLYPWIEDRLFQLSSAIIVHSQGQLERLPAKAQVKAEVIEFGIDQLLTHHKDFQKSMTVGCFGHLSPHKGIETVIEACARAADSVPDLHLVVAGAVPETMAAAQYVEQLRELVAVRLGDRAEVHTNLPEDEFEAVYERVSLVCFGLKRATQSTTFYRALAHRKPVVVTDIGGVAEVTAREALGRVVPVDDVSQMASAIIEMLTNTLAYRDAVAAAERYAACRTWQANSLDHLDLYERLEAA